MTEKSSEIPNDDNTPDQEKVKKDPEKVVQLTKYAEGAEVKYDTETLREFLDLVFHGIGDDAKVLTWNARGNIPGYPILEEPLYERLKRSRKPFALYYSTASAEADDEGRYFNRKALFKAMHVVVLDDIGHGKGSKHAPEDLPEGLTPTYIIESSPDNFQYGYVLEEPITELPLAQALIQVVYEADMSDGGGRLANKVVRLPGGVNGKPGPNQLFHVKLHSMDGPIWTPDKLLEVMDTGVHWSDILEDPDVLLRRRQSKQKALPWAPVPAHHATMDGVVDILQEWFYAENMVKQERGDWIDIECPWAHEHSDEHMNTAGYSPLGHGDEHARQRRGFHCFHESCKHRTTVDLLQWAASNGGPETPLHDPVALEVSRYALDAAGSLVWDMHYDSPVPMPLQSLDLLMPGQIQFYTADDKLRRIARAKAFKEHPQRVLVYGQAYDPTTEAKIVKSPDGQMQVNRYHQPPWGDGAYDKAEVATFLDFIEYLIPNPDERDFWLQWLAAKTQNMGFRGPGILMIAKAQGTGRTTLADMLSHLLGQHNCETVPFDKLTGGGDFNEFLARPMIFSNETLAVARDDSVFKVYERMKELIDPRPTQVRINPKYGRQYTQMTYASFMLFSNHENAVYAAANDRRLYVISNPTEPAPPERFVELNEWLEILDDKGHPAWCRHVWRWLRQMPVDLKMLESPAQMTVAKHDMIARSTGPIGHCVQKVLEAWPLQHIAASEVKDALQDYRGRMIIEDEGHFHRAILRALETEAPTLSHLGKRRISGSNTQRVRRVMCKTRGIPNDLLDDEWYAREASKREDLDLKTIIKDAIEDALSDLEL